VVANQTVPNGVLIQGLIDTGASNTCVDPSVLSQLGLTPTGMTQINTPSTGTQAASAATYDVSLLIAAVAGQLPFVLDTIPVIQTELLAAQGFQALIGRDVLQSCLMTYDGRNGLFSIAY
jgi:predicted aspartyl protease